jgi:uncharacterized protein YndB with AHSA1/START domain
MSKHKFIRDYELKASPKYLYPYISTASGLAQWFADKVSAGEENSFNFVWDKKEHPARLTMHKLNKHAKFEFISPNAGDNGDPSFIEFWIDTNELTQSVFLKVADYSEADSEDDLQELWDGLVATLKEIVSGYRKAES